VRLLTAILAVALLSLIALSYAMADPMSVDPTGGPWGTPARTDSGQTPRH
jgi:hypothetical protein